ncbi:MAG: potassium-transporting ATPase subunit B, partial [Rhodospirillales bacterium 20-64-7]
MTHARDRRSSLLDRTILLPAAADALRKLDPRVMIRNPVMFVVEVVATLTTILFLRDLGHDLISGRAAADAHAGAHLGFTFQIILWLWVTIIFANFAEAVAEGRGKAQAATLRRARTETMAHRLTPGGEEEQVAAPALKPGDLVMVRAGELIPSDGEVVEGIASIDESAITGESAPVIRESGGDRSAVTGGTRVLSDWIKVRITAAQGSTFLDRMIALVEGAERQKTPNEIALNILLAGLSIIFVFA